MTAQKIAVLIFVIVTLGLIAWGFLVFWMLHMLTFPCETIYPGYTCNQAIWITWFREMGAPIVIWAGFAAALYLKWGRQ